MTWLAAHLTLSGVALALMAATVLILRQDRSPQSVFAWLLLIGFVPYLGLPLYLVLGFRKSRSAYDAIAFAERAEPPASSSTERLLVGSGLPHAEDDNRFDLLTSGPMAHASLGSLVGGAQRSIDACFYAVDDDDVGADFVSRLIERRKAGVEVRLIVDAIGALYRPRNELRALRDAGGQVETFSPILHSPFRSRINLRNHRKILIADGRIVFAGGMNVGANYLAPEPREAGWKDLAYTIEGPLVRDFATVFWSGWQAVSKIDPLDPTEVEQDLPPPAAKSGCTRAQLAVSGPDVTLDALHDALLQAIFAARSRIRICTPYFLPTPSLLEALKIASRRGTRVQIVVPAQSNQWMADLARGSILRELRASGCEIALYRPGMLHAKAWIIDEIGFVGSANFDVRSLLLNFETMLVLYSPADVQSLRAWFDALMPATDTNQPEVSLPRRVAERIVRLQSPIL